MTMLLTILMIVVIVTMIRFVLGLVFLPFRLMFMMIPPMFGPFGFRPYRHMGRHRRMW